MKNRLRPWTCLLCLSVVGAMMSSVASARQGRSAPESGALVALPLRLKAKVGSSFRSTIRTELTVHASKNFPAKTSAFSGSTVSRITRLSGANFVSETVVQKFQIGRDDLKVEKVWKRLLAGKHSGIFNQRGTIIETNSHGPIASFNFPTGPVRPGSRWRGFERSKNSVSPLQFTLDRFIRVRGHDVAVIKRNYPAAKNETASDWLDVDEGFVIKTTERTVRKLPDGRTMEGLVQINSYR